MEVHASVREQSDARCREYQRERRPLCSSAMKRGPECEQRDDDSDPGKAAEPSEKSAKVREVCGCDEWQLGSGCRPPNVRPLAQPG
jgi:hypothetical protein